MITEDGSWNLDLFQVWFPEDVIQLIKGIPPPHPFASPDKISWCCTSAGVFFSIKSAYKMLKEGDWNPKDDKSKSVWKLSGPQRVWFFIWTVLQGRLLSNMERVRWGLAVNPSCPICNFHSEDILHILRDCAIARNVQNQVIPGNCLSIFFSNNLQDWLLANLQDNSKVHKGGSSWACLFGLLIWRLWKSHNLFIFQRRSWSSREMVKVSLSQVNQLFSALRADFKGSFKPPLKRNRLRLLFFSTLMGQCNQYLEMQLLEEWFVMPMEIGFLV